MARLKEKYQQEIVAKLQSRFGIANRWAVPKLAKIVVNRGVGKAVENKKRIDAAQAELAKITGQWPAIARARVAISNFRLRENLPIGCKVTLRGDRMYEFLDRLISVVIPRIRDFRGMPRNAFDGRGNYAMGLTDQVVFPEIKIDDVEFVQGMDVCFHIVNSNDELSLALMGEFGFPFKQ
ncbi:MAG: 50S ribosomal protein L5 [Planctomycetes bacterium]|nr:50S ribosomal protein L5 [Planctomycetota bacterium]